MSSLFSLFSAITSKLNVCFGGFVVDVVFSKLTAASSMFFSNVSTVSCFASGITTLPFFISLLSSDGSFLLFSIIGLTLASGFLMIFFVCASDSFLIASRKTLPTPATCVPSSRFNSMFSGACINSFSAIIILTHSDSSCTDCYRWCCTFKH